MELFIIKENWKKLYFVFFSYLSSLSIPLDVYGIRYVHNITERLHHQRYTEPTYRNYSLITLNDWRNHWTTTQYNPLCCPFCPFEQLLEQVKVGHSIKLLALILLSNPYSSCVLQITSRYSSVQYSVTCIIQSIAIPSSVTDPFTNGQCANWFANTPPSESRQLIRKR